MKRIIMDLDCVIGDIWGIALPHLNQYTGKNISFDEIKQYDIRSLFEIEFKDFFKVIRDNNILERMKPYHRSASSIMSLKRDGYGIDIATARGYEPNAFSITESWLQRNKIHFDSLTIIQNGENKSDLMKEISDSYEMAIDDLPENLMDFGESGITKKLILIDQPWNSRADNILNLSRHRSLASFVDRHVLSFEPS